MKFQQLIVVVAALLIAPVALAQTTFTVTIANKTAAHPNFGMGWPEGYVIDGVEGDELTLIRGESYVFQMSGVSPTHPFQLSTSDSGGDGGANAWTNGVIGNGASGNGMLTFDVPVSAPDLLYYQCEAHEFMGWKLNIINPVSVDEEIPGTGFDLSVAYPNPSSNSVSIGLSLDQSRDVSVEVFDVAGRRVAVLHEGAMAAGADHRFVFGQDDLPAGVYLVRATAGGASVERRVTLVR